MIALILAVVKQLTTKRGDFSMGKNKTKVTGFRIEDESILEKLNIIAKNNCRTRNKEVEFALKMYVENYEKQNGSVNIDIHHNHITGDLNVGK